MLWALKAQLNVRGFRKQRVRVTGLLDLSLTPGAHTAHSTESYCLCESEWDCFTIFVFLTSV